MMPDSVEKDNSDELETTYNKGGQTGKLYDGWSQCFSVNTLILVLVKKEHRTKPEVKT